MFLPIFSEGLSKARNVSLQFNCTIQIDAAHPLAIAYCELTMIRWAEEAVRAVDDVQCRRCDAIVSPFSAAKHRSDRFRAKTFETWKNLFSAIVR